MKPCFLLLHFTKSTVCGYATKDLQKKMVSYQFLHVGLFSTVPTKHWIFFYWTPSYNHRSFPKIERVSLEIFSIVAGDFWESHRTRWWRLTNVCHGHAGGEKCPVLSIRVYLQRDKPFRLIETNQRLFQRLSRLHLRSNVFVLQKEVPMIS